MEPHLRPADEGVSDHTRPDDAWPIEVATPDDREQELLPAGLEDLPPGPFLAAIVWSVDRARLSDRDAIRLLAARDRLVSSLQAERSADIAEVAGRGEDDLHEFAALEVGAALHLTRTAAESEVAFAVEVTERLPQVRALLRQGHIDVRRARVLADGTAHLPVDTARQVVAEVADRAPVATTGQLRSLLKRRCIEIDPGDAADRLEHAVEDRRVVVEATTAGSANLLLLDLPPEVAVEARERIDAYARALPADDRTMDQRRADAAADLLCGRGRAFGRGTIDLTVDLTTLLGLADTPGDLGGWGPVVAEIARRIAEQHENGRWQATVVDEAGDPHTVALRRRPTTTQARRIRARHRTCIFPGCRRAARSADLDHTRRYADGGPTLERNLAPLCRFHHRAKDEGGWRYRRRSDGDHVWTSPMGRVYTTSGRSP